MGMENRDFDLMFLFNEDLLPFTVSLFTIPVSFQVYLFINLAKVWLVNAEGFLKWEQHHNTFILISDIKLL